MERRYGTDKAEVQSQNALVWTGDDGGVRGGPFALAATGIALTGFAIARFRKPLAWCFLAGFTRIVKPRALDHRVRQDIVQLLHQEPGLHRAEIARRLELAPGQTIHHIRVLVHQGILSEVAMGWSKHYVPVGRFSPENARRLVVARNGSVSALLAAARQHPGVSLQRLALIAGRSKAQASKGLRRLERVGLVRIERVGRALRVYAAENPIPS